MRHISEFDKMNEVYQKYFKKGEKSAHRIINSSHTETLVYFECDTLNSLELVCYPNSDKIGVMVDGKSGTFYKKNTNVDYFEGE